MNLDILPNNMGANSACWEREREQTFFVPYFLKSLLFEEEITGQGAVDIVLGKGGGMHTKGMIK